MRFALLLLFGCNEPKAPVDPNLTSFDVVVQRYAHPPPACASTEKALVQPTTAMLSLRPGFRDCYAMLQIESPAAEGKLALQVYAGPSGEVCAVRVKTRVGLSAGFERCAEELVKATHFDAAGRYDIPLSFAPEPPTIVADLRTLEGCARTLAIPTTATVAFASDESGNVGGINVDPFSGDQEALACVAEALAPSAGGLPVGRRFAARVQMFP